MNVINTPQTGHRDYSRRSVIRKAAYSAPVVFAIAAAPNAALGASGPNNGKNNNGFGNGTESGPAPGNSGNNNGHNSKDKANNNGR